MLIVNDMYFILLYVFLQLLDGIYMDGGYLFDSLLFITTWFMDMLDRVN